MIASCSIFLLLENSNEKTATSNAGEINCIELCHIYYELDKI